MTNEWEPIGAERSEHPSANEPLRPSPEEPIEQREGHPRGPLPPGAAPEGPGTGADVAAIPDRTDPAGAPADAAQGERVEARRANPSQPTARQIAANRANAQRSTGPSTPEGKTRVARNAWKHGLLSKEMVLAPEEGAALAAFEQRVREDWAPVGETEEALVDLMVAGLWRLRRCALVEAGFFAAQHHAAARADTIDELRQLMTGDGAETAIVREDLQGIATHPFADNAAVQAALVRAVQCDDALRSPGVRQARAFAAEAPSFATLIRHEASLRRGVFQALHELQRRQAYRRGEPVDLPVAADVNVDIQTSTRENNDE